MTRAFKQRSTSKFGNVRTGHYDSKREADYAQELVYRQMATNGDVADWLEQVAVKLPGGVKYVVDFLVFFRDGTWKFVEVKGHETQTWRNKMKQLAACRPEIFKRLEVVG